jgi:hypothetical protein
MICSSKCGALFLSLILQGFCLISSTVALIPEGLSASHSRPAGFVSMLVRYKREPVAEEKAIIKM